VKEPLESARSSLKIGGSNRLSQDILSASRLGLDALAGVTDIAEALQQSIVNPLGSKNKAENTSANNTSSRGISGLIYTCLRKVNRLLTTGVDRLIVNGQAQTLEISRSDAMHAAVSALNGVMGDRLLTQNNSLAIKMAFRRNGKTLKATELKDLVEQADGKVLLMVHGLCMNDVQWTRKDHNHGEQLAQKFNLLPIYLHYNSGRHISENGRELAELLHTLENTVTVPVKLNILAHSMGGLVSRSACHHAKNAGQSWLTSLEKMIFLGTPHHGAPLEKGGNWLGQLLDISPYSAPFVPLVKLRSSGVTDLRYGNVCDEDWQNQDRFSSQADPRNPVALPAHVNCYALASSIAKKPNSLTDKLIGDGLVAVNSALGKHKEHRHKLNIGEPQQWLGYNISHMGLLNEPDVYEMLCVYFTEGAQGS
jgi:pimeloyl-ACP methyl ester carboxylesterase